jgi:hypothetical protein
MSVRIITILALAVLSAVPVAAQRGRTPANPTPEAALRLRERLQLSEEQMTQLRAFREEDVAARRSIMNSQMELRSKARAGEMTPEAFREQARAQRDEIRTRIRERGDRVGGVLNDTQRGQLNQFRQQQARRQFQQGSSRGQGSGRLQGRVHRQQRTEGQPGQMRRPPGGTGEPIGN